MPQAKRLLIRWQIILGVCLIMASVAVYFIHYLIFRDARHIFIYLIGDIGFVFIEVLLVTLVLHQLLHHHEKQALLKKLNMVIGSFFSEVGTELIRLFSGFSPRTSHIADKLLVSGEWSPKKFQEIQKFLRNYDYAVEHSRGDLGRLKAFALEKRSFLLVLLENANLLEHESFTDLLWAVFHLTEELAGRKDLTHLPPSDLRHLEGDIRRAYRLLVLEWLSYMRHLQTDYPYLFSLAVRTNPFNPRAAPEVY